VSNQSIKSKLIYWISVAVALLVINTVHSTSIQSINADSVRNEIEMNRGIIFLDEGPNSMLWMADEHAVFRFDGKQTNRLEIVPLREKNFQITGLVATRDNYLIIATYQHGIHLYNIRTGAWKQPNIKDSTHQLTNIVALKFWKESLIVILAQEKLYLYNFVNDSFSQLRFLSESEPPIKGISLSQTSDFSAWNSTSVWTYHKNFNRLSEIVLPNKTHDINQVYQIRDQIWLLHGEKLSLYHKKNGQWLLIDQISGAYRKMLEWTSEMVSVLHHSKTTQAENGHVNPDTSGEVTQVKLEDKKLTPGQKKLYSYSNIQEIFNDSFATKWLILNSPPYLIRSTLEVEQRNALIAKLAESAPLIANTQVTHQEQVNFFASANFLELFKVNQNESKWIDWTLGAVAPTQNYSIEWKYSFQNEWQTAINKVTIINPARILEENNDPVRLQVRARFPEYNLTSQVRNLPIKVVLAANEGVSWYFLSLFITGLVGLSTAIIVLIKRRQRAASALAANQKMELALLSSGDEVWDWDIQSDALSRLNPNPRWDLDWMGKTASVNIYGNMHDADMQRFKTMLRELLKGQRELFDLSFRLIGIDNDWVWVRAKGKVIERDIDGKATRFTGVIHDVDQFKRTKQKLKIIATSFENTFNGAWIADKERKIINVNKAFCKIKGTTENRVLGQLVKIPHIHGQDENLEKMMWDVLDQLGHWQAEMWDVRENGEEFPVEITIDSVVDESEGLSHYVAVFSDITFKRKSEQELRRLANYDVLTELPNRSFMEAVVEQSIYHCKRKQEKMCLMQLDLDDFKDVNDSLGHRAGDELLKLVARRLDTVIEDPDQIARIGGDEFAILIHNVDSPALMADLAQKCIEVIEQPIHLQDQELNVKCSIGVVFYPTDGENFETLVRNADTAMHHQKRSGKAGCKFYSEEMNQSLLQKLALESNLRKAIQLDEFVIQYQPKVCADHSDLNGIEALVRWIRPDGQFVSPGLFIPFAEESGLIVELGDLILKKACIETKQLFEQNRISGRLAVNLSGKQFTQMDIVERVMRIINETGFDPNNLELEITEGAVMNETERAIDKMHQFNKMGIQLSIDDFGTGYSSLSYLKRFPVSTLKIDRSFIIEIHQTVEDKNIVFSVIGLAHSLGLKVVAEGVEYVDQASVLKELGCDVIQGYLYSRPLIYKDLEAFIEGDGWQSTLPTLQKVSAVRA
jgi:diguanylate cyclase (GGDEF)-like protein/PAS domain S-box-containing protein